MGACIVQVPINMHLLGITCLYSNADVVAKS